MKSLQRGVCLLLLLVTVSAQSSLNARQTDEASDLWLVRARSLTDELVKDSDTLDQYDHALLWARLGRLWQRDDVEQSRVWLERAVESVESAPDKEDAIDRGQRLNTVRALLVILGAQDKALSARLNKVITNAAEASASIRNSENGRARAEVALAVLDSDPRQALQLGLAACRRLLQTGEFALETP